MDGTGPLRMPRAVFHEIALQWDAASGVLPLEFGGQAGAGPARERIRLEIAQMRRRAPCGSSSRSPSSVNS